VLTALVSFILAVLVALAAHLPVVRQYVLEYGREYLEASQQIGLEASRLDYNLLAVSTTLRDVRLRSAAARDLPPLARAQEIHLNLRLSDLILGRITVEEARFEGLRIHVYTDEEGRSNIPALPREETEDPEANGGLPLVIESLKANGPALTFDDLSQQARLRLPAWQLRVTGERSSKKHTLTFEPARSGALAWQGRELPLRLDLALEFNPERLSFQQARLSLGQSSVSASGAVNSPFQPKLDLELTAGLDLAQLRRLAGLSEQVAGTLRVGARLRNAPGELEVSADIAGDAVSYGRFRGAAVEAQPVWRAGAERLELKKLSIRSPQGSLQAEGDLALADTAGESRLQGRFENFDLRALSLQLELPVEAASRASGVLDLAWDGLEFTQPRGQAELSLSAPAATPEENVLPLSGSLRLNAQGERLLLSAAPVEALGARLEGDFTVESLSGLGGQARVEAASLSRAVAEADAFLGNPPEESVAPAGLEGQASLAAGLSGTLEAPELSVQASGRNLQAAGVEGASFQAIAAYKELLLSVERLELRWQEQTVQAGGSVDFAPEAPALDLRLRARQASLQAVLAGLGQELPVEGFADLDAEVGGNTEAPRARLSASANELTAYGERLGRLRVEAGFADQQVEVSELVLEKPRKEGGAGFLRASGSYDLDAGEYSVTADTESFELDSLELPGETAVRGALDLAVKGRGTAASPLEFDLAARELRVAERPFGEVQLRASLQNEQAEVAIEAPTLKVQGEGRMQISAPYAVEFNVAAQGTELAPLKLAGIQGNTLEGLLNAAIQGAGELDNWRDGRLNLVVRELRAAVDGMEVRNDGPLEAAFENRELRIRSARLTAGESALSMAGSLPLEEQTGAGELTLEANLAPPDLLKFAPQAADWTASGEVELRAAVNGSLENMRPAVWLDVRDGSFASPATLVPFENIQVAVRTRGDSILLESAAAEWAAGRISASGELPVRLLGAADLLPVQEGKEGPARLDLAVEGLRVEATEAVPEDVKGVLGWETRVEAADLSLEALRADTRFTELRLQLADFEIAQPEPVRIALAEGAVRVEQFELRGPETQLAIRGDARLTEPSSLDLQVEAKTGAGMLTFLSEDVQATGDTTLQLAVAGTFEQPQISGVAGFEDVSAAVDAPPLQAERLNARFRIDPERITIEDLTGSLNGGGLQGSGGFSYAGGRIDDVGIDLSVKDLFLEFPAGLRTASETDLRIASQDEQILIGGEVRILEGSFRQPLEVESEILEFLRSGTTIELAEERSPLLSRIRYGLGVRTVGPIVVDNNLARLSATSDLRLVGTYYRPSIVGRLNLEEGGELFLAEKRYVVDSGRVDFVNENRIEAAVNIVARTQASGYDIELRMTGDTEDLTTRLSSEPPLSEPDIISVLLTGRTLEEAQGSGFNVAREQALSYLTGRVGGRFSRVAEERLGLSQVRVEPNLIAAESDPSVRLTVGEDLRPDLRLIYSMNLADSGDQIYITEYDLTRRFETRAVKQSDNSYRLSFEHNLQLGGAVPFRERAALQPRTVRTVVFAGNPVFPEEELHKRLGVREGETYDFFKLRKGMDRLSKLYQERDHLEARVRLRQEKSSQTVDLTIQIEAGPKVEFEFEGADVPEKVRRAVRQEWRRGVFQAQRLQEAAGALREWLIESRYLQPEIEPEAAAPSPELRRVVFRIEPGVRFENVEVVFEGAEGFSRSQLLAVVEEQYEPSALYVAPRRVRDLIERVYKQQGYLDVSVSAPRYELQPETRSGQVVVPVKEGPRYRFGEVTFRGNQAFPDHQLAAAIPFEPERLYEPELLDRAVTRLEEFYWARGYNDVEIRAGSRRAPERSDLNVVFEIIENRQGVVQAIHIEGNEKVSDAFIRKRIRLEEGAILDFERTDESRKRLYLTGAFTLVDFETSPAGLIEDRARKPIRLTAKVREVRPYRVRYGGFVDTDRGPGVIADFENRNTLGSARTVGVRGRYDSEFKEVRGFFTQPFNWDIPATLSTTGFRSREILQREASPDFITDRTGFTLEQELEFQEDMLLTYGYRFEQTRTFDEEPVPDCPFPPDDPLCRFDETFNIAPLRSSFSWDTRDDLLDATRGFFTSHAVEFAESALGSDLRFLKYFGQYYKYVPLSKPAEVPFSKTKRPRFIYAGGARVGLGGGFGGQDLILSERFFAGGGTTIRGFEQNEVGPKDFLGDPAGGQALFIVNNEIRFPVISFFEGVGFLDLGNVYEKVGDFDPFDLRKSAGVGLRVRTPFFLLRLDYGVKLDRRENESSGEFFFSIGQAF